MADTSLSPDRVIASLMEGKSRREVMVILARLEHGGAGIYQSLAANERNAKAKAALLAGAEREEQNSALLKTMTQVKRPVREMRQGARTACAGTMLLVPMYLLPRLRRQDETRLPELFGPANAAQFVSSPGFSL
jgi:hypothetical protein